MFIYKDTKEEIKVGDIMYRYCAGKWNIETVRAESISDKQIKVSILYPSGRTYPGKIGRFDDQPYKDFQTIINVYVKHFREINDGIISILLKKVEIDL